MLTYVIRRVLIAIPVLFGITIMNFVIINLAPGNPVDMYMTPDTPPELLELRKEQLGLNDPIIVQYFKWLGQLLSGNLGYSFSTSESVGSLIGERLGQTMLLGIAALILGLLIALPIGIMSAVKQNSKFDYLMTGLSFVGTSIPQFFLGLLCIYIFAVQLGWLPVGGTETLGGGGGLGDRLWHMVLPSIALAVGIAGRKVRYIRASMLDVLKQDYLRTARAKGLKEFIVTNKHALRNALIPVITVVGMEIPMLFGGAVIVEQLFQWPGIGQLTIQSILSRDYSTIMGLNLVAAIVVLGANLLTDVFYSVADPRIKYH
ncbi:ABC transporter permease [Cohnella thailandensis]|uniref:ABC transporter permease n=1 Tax=Cohnella thailandensis TaxID=557557 RepID=A0A841SXB4_9BACL|nr:ABC transporter permease [Cohnella thailandensis]MBB6634805.1 ABC transporter permease [Cohnella thailandensis]MBP1975974.1 peptide/nickel transport system permease protein [Cohnella thailandensis]